MGQTPIFIRERLIISENCRERFLPLEAPWASPLREREVSMGGVSELRGTYEIGRPKPDFHLLLCTLEGAGSLLAPGAAARLEPGTLLAAPARSPYSYRLEGSGWRILWFHLKVRPWWSPLASSPLTLRPAPEEVQGLEAAAEGLMRESRSSLPGAERAASLYAQLLETLIERAAGLGEENRASPGTGPLARLERAWRLAESDLARAWTVESLAKEASLSRSHFHRLALERFGEPPMRRLARLRMLRAEFLLASTEATVAEAAARVGYESPFAFSAAFKRWSGRPPAQARRPGPERSGGG